MTYKEASVILNDAAALRQMLDTHGLLLISGFPLDQDKYGALASNFGEMESVPTSHRSPEHPFIRVQSNIPGVGVNGGGQYWHSDGPWRKSPTSTTLLLCEIAPKLGGETLFVDMRKAYDALSENDKAGLSQLIGDYPCRSSTEKKLKRGQAEDTLEMLDTLEYFEDLKYPLIRCHPRTGRQSLYLNQYWLKGIDGMGHEEGQQLLLALLLHSTKPENIYTHEWNVGDLLIWDNDSMLHKANETVNNSPKKTLRITIAGA